LRAPIAVTVEVRGTGRRAFRLARSLGEDGLRLERAAPFEIGRPVEVAFTLPDQSETLTLRAEVMLSEDDDEESGGRELGFLSPPASARALVHRYVAQRLGLPGSG
jgi:hypothetical protein